MREDRAGRVRRPLQLTAAAFALALVGLGGSAAPADAHNYLVSSIPAAGSVLTELPAEFIVTTNDVLLDFGGENTGSAGALEVRGPDGEYYGDGCVAVRGASIATGAALGPAGDYTVVWRVVSTDGHPVSNEFGFTWRPDASAVPSVGSATAPVCPGSADAGSADAGPADAAVPPGDAGAEASGDDAEFLSALAWIGGALGAMVLGVLATMLVLRRGRDASRRPPRAPADESRGDINHSA